MKTPEGPRAKPEKPAFMLAPRPWCKDSQGNTLPSPGDAKRALPDAWRPEHRTKDGGRQEKMC
jgi:hypothetical protein